MNPEKDQPSVNLAHLVITVRLAQPALLNALSDLTVRENQRRRVNVHPESMVIQQGSNQAINVQLVQPVNTAQMDRFQEVALKVSIVIQVPILRHRALSFALLDIIALLERFTPQYV
jgi:hypothetical protein